MDSNPILSGDAKKRKQAFLAPLPGMDSNPILSGDAKKCQQAFLALLPGKAYRLKNRVGHVHDNMHVR